MFAWLQNILFHHRTVFKIGEAVVAHAAGPMMVITIIHSQGSLKFPLVECRWYDPETKSNRTNIFRASELIPFDWDSAKRDLKTP